MHGIILTELEKFVTQHHGASTWSEILNRAGLRNKIYLTSATYPDSEVVAIVTAASKLSGTPPAELLENFGAALVPGLVQVYGRLIKRGWRALDLIERTEETMHSVVRRQNPGAEPPRLRCTRVSPNEVLVTYTSERKLCAVAKGIIRGIAAHFQEPIVIRERECMLKGAPACVISAARSASRPSS
jgi:predicted hydrocarbon binding protein